MAPRGMHRMGEMDLGSVPSQWERIFALADDVERCEAPRSDLGFTARKYDESQPAGHRGYILAYGHIQAGLEHIDALRGLLQHHGATPRAPWTLMRAIFEAGFWTTWLMEPVDGLVRRQRGLRLEVRGMVERTNFYDDFLRVVGHLPRGCGRQPTRPHDVAVTGGDDLLPDLRHRRQTAGADDDEAPGLPGVRRAHLDVLPAASEEVSYLNP